MENRKVFDKRSVKLEDVMREGYIPFLGGRPERETVITSEDVINLTIALNSSVSMEEFLAMI